MYVYARRVGVDVDPAVIPRGNSAYQAIAAAIRSPDVEQKLNALLAVELTGFSNVSEVIGQLLAVIVFCVVGVVVTGLLLLFRQRMLVLYPLSFVAIGHQTEALHRLERKREIWTVAVVIGFLVNVIAGLIVALFT